MQKGNERKRWQKIKKTVKKNLTGPGQVKDFVEKIYFSRGDTSGHFAVDKLKT
jgi:hypothetical protein